MEQPKCFLCRTNDTNNVEILYKICDCNDSIICVECYNNDETSKMDTCGICRKKYEYEYKRNFTSFFNILLINLIKYGTILGIELFPPLYLYSDSENSIEHNIFLIISLFCILFGNIINYYLLNIFIQGEAFNNLLNSFITIKLVYICLMFLLILYGYEKNKLTNYFYIIIFILYILPLMFFPTILIGKNIINFKKYINEMTIIRKIKIKNIIKTNIELQGTINNV